MPEEPCLQLDPPTRRRLTLVKQLYRRGLHLSDRHRTKSDHTLSVIVFDFAIETALKTATSALDPDRKPSTTFEGVLQQCDELFADKEWGKVPDRLNINYVHGLRNNAQHHAQHPSESLIDECRIYTRDFLEHLVQRVWNISLSFVHTAELVSNARAKEHLLRSEGCLERGELEDAVKYAAAGLQVVLDRAPSALAGPDFPSSACAIRVEEADGKARSSKQLLETVRALRNTGLRIWLGLDANRHERFRGLAGSAVSSLGGEIQWFRRPNAEALTPENAEWVVSYCVETALELEERTKQVGDLLSL